MGVGWWLGLQGSVHCAVRFFAIFFNDSFAFEGAQAAAPSRWPPAPQICAGGGPAGGAVLCVLVVWQAALCGAFFLVERRGWCLPCRLRTV